MSSVSDGEGPLRRPYNKQFEREVLQHHLLNKLMKNLNFRSRLDSLREPWREIQSLLAKDDDAMLWHFHEDFMNDRRLRSFIPDELLPIAEGIEQFTVDFGLALNGEPATWAMREIAALLNGGKIRTPGMRVIYIHQGRVHLNASLEQGSVEVGYDKYKDAPRDKWLVEPAVANQFDEWKKLRRLAHQAIDQELDRMKADFSSMYWARRNSETLKDYLKVVESIVHMLTGHVSTESTRDDRRRVCRILGIDPPKTRRAKISQ